MRVGGAVPLWRRYIDFVWLFDAVPPRADRVARSAVVRANRDRGRRFLPVYLRRYFRMLIGWTLAGTILEGLSAPIVAGACFTVSTAAALALLLAGIGFLAIRFNAFVYRA